jgi:hypothetical protein
MKTIFFVLLTGIVLITNAQEINVAAYAKDAFPVTGTKKVLDGVKKLALPQTNVLFKRGTTTTILQTERGAFGGRKSGGKAVQVRQVAYLEFTDGDMTDAEFTELATYCNTAIENKAKAAGIEVVAWNAIEAAPTYKEFDADNDDMANNTPTSDQIYRSYNANNGRMISKYNPTKFMSGLVAYGKQKKINRLAEELGDATLIVQTLVVDFVDIKLEADVKSGTSETALGGGLYRVTNWSNYKADGDLFANIKLSGAKGPNGAVETSRVMFFDHRNTIASAYLGLDIPSLLPYASDMANDQNKTEIKAKRDNVFAKDFNGVPKVIKSTKEAYKLAVKKVFDYYADIVIAKFVANK